MIRAGEKAIHVDPDIPFGYAMAYHYLALDRYAEAADALQRAALRKLEHPEMLVTRYYLAFLKGDQAGMDREIARAPAEHSEDWMLHNKALVLARSGQMREARTLWGKRGRVGATGRQARGSRDLRSGAGGVRSPFRECCRRSEMGPIRAGSGERSRFGVCGGARAGKTRPWTRSNH